MIVYKYIDDHILDLLKKRSLKFTPRDFLNDPFELYPYFEPNELEKFDLLSEIGEKAYQDNFLKSLPEYAFNMMSPSEWLVFEKNTRNQENPYKIEDPDNWILNYYRDLVPGLMRILNNTFGILSFTEDPLNIIMWTHYGNDNKGFGLGFNTDNNFFYEKENIELNYRNLRRVNYKLERPLIRDPYNLDELNETFFNKSIQWGYEKEWRVIRRLDDANEIIENDNLKLHLFDFQPKIVKEIYFGLRSDIEIRKKVIEIIQSNAEYQNVKFFQIELDNKEYKLIPKIIEI